MLRFPLYLAALITAVFTVASDREFGAEALLTAVVMSGIAIVIFRRFTDDKFFVTHVFLGALVARIAFGLLVHSFDLRMFAGPDSIVYDLSGSWVSDYWQGIPLTSGVDIQEALSMRGSGWGMTYLMGAIYLVAGKSILVAQTFCGVIGAATAPLIYYCCRSIYHNSAVAKTAAIGVAFFPALVIWSSQLLKDGLIVFLLVLALTMAIHLQKKFTMQGIILLVAALVGIMSLRFYTFYVVAIAIVSGFVIGVETSVKIVLQRTAIMSIVALSLIYFGFIKIASADLETYASLDRINYSRSVMANSESGYGGDTDVSTTGGALTAIPVGFAYLMLAPFPWEMKNLRQSLTLPDVLLWWSLIPLMVYGIWYSVRNKLRANIPIFVFTFILTLAYSMFQGNLGAAYRQRTQIQVFLMMFIGVGWSLLMEKRADKKLIEQQRVKEMVRRQRARLETSH
jgi:hypothetical protein